MSNDLDVTNRFYMHYTGGAPPIGSLAGAPGTVAGDWGSQFAALCSPTLALTEVVLTDLSSASGEQAIWNGSVVGTSAGAKLPAGTCALLNLTIFRRYRGGKPRLYLPYFTESDLNDDQTWKSASISALAASWTNFISALPSAIVWGAGTLAGQVNVSYYSGYTNYTGSGGRAKVRNDIRTGGAVVDTILSHSINTHVASQRRRNLIRS